MSQNILYNRLGIEIFLLSIKMNPPLLGGLNVMKFVLIF